VADRADAGQHGVERALHAAQLPLAARRRPKADLLAPVAGVQVDDRQPGPRGAAHRRLPPGLRLRLGRRGHDRRGGRLAGRWAVVGAGPAHRRGAPVRLAAVGVRPGRQAGPAHDHGARQHSWALPAATVRPTRRATAGT
jgi:hypothetical protein